MPRSTTKTSPSEVEKRDASPKRKLPHNVMSLWFDEFLKKDPSINPEILITKLIDSTPVQANFLACKWRSELTWLTAFGAPKELDEDELYEDEWVDPFFDEEDPSSSSDEEEPSDNEES